MFINWAHFLIPKFSFIFSFIANPMFVHLINTEMVFQFGDYQYLLKFFAIFNMIASMTDILIPICVHTYSYATVVFIADGVFSERSMFAESMISYRLSLIAGTYGILNCHFIFRYMIVKNSHFVAKNFLPHGLVASICLVISHIMFWGIFTNLTMDSGGESRNYVKESFEKVFGEIENVNMRIVVFSEVSSKIIFGSWLGTIIVTMIASYSMILYFVLGYKIMSCLNKGITTMSHKTTQMQKRLIWALAVQTAIPICVSFMPCTLCLYGTAFRIDFVSWVNWVSSIAVSMFPFLDPIAIMLCLPALRTRLFMKLGIYCTPKPSNQIQSITRV